MAPPGYDNVPLGSDQPITPGSQDANQISYADMMRYQMISQYQQRYADQQRFIPTAPRFRYGVNDIPERSFFQRQNEVNRMSLSSGLTKGMADMAAWGAASLGLTALGVGGMSVAGIAVPMIAPLIPMHFFTKGVDMTFQRQRAMQGMAADIQQYREQIGMPGMSYFQATQFGSNMAGGMFAQRQFFNPQQQQEILKIGLANNLISAKGVGMNTGDIKTLETNVKKFTEVVQTAVKTLNTTIVGGASVIKEMQMQGFGTMNQIQTGLLTAKAYGNMTGLGAQNLLQIGAAGAAATQGTPWQAAAGATMYQSGAAQAAYMAKGWNPQYQQSVMMAGGVARAGALIAQTQMNFMQSGMGARAAAFLMDAKGNLDARQLNRLMTGEVTGHEMMMRGSEIAHQMGPGGRVMFQRRRSELWNELAKNNPEVISKTMMETFAAWGTSRRGTAEQQAQAFARMYSGGDERAENALADWLMAPKGFSAMGAERQVSAMLGQKVGPAQSAMRTLYNSLLTAPPDQTLGWNFGDFTRAGISAFNTVDAAMYSTGGAKGYLGRRIGQKLEDVVNRVTGSKYGVFNRYDIGNTERAYRKLYGLAPTTLTEEDIAQYQKYSTRNKPPYAKSNIYAGDIGEIDLRKEYGINVEANFRNMTREDLLRVAQTTMTGLGEGTMVSVLKNRDFLKSANIPKEIANRMIYNKDHMAPEKIGLSYINQLADFVSKTNKQADALTAETVNFKKTIDQEGGVSHTEYATAQRHVNWLPAEDQDRLAIADTRGMTKQQKMEVMAAKENLAYRLTAKTQGLDIDKLMGFSDVTGLRRKQVQDFKETLGLAAVRRPVAGGVAGAVLSQLPGPFGYAGAVVGAVVGQGAIFTRFSQARLERIAGLKGGMNTDPATTMAALLDKIQAGGVMQGKVSQADWDWLGRRGLYKRTDMGGAKRNLTAEADEIIAKYGKMVEEAQVTMKYAKTKEALSGIKTQKLANIKGYDAASLEAKRFIESTGVGAQGLSEGAIKVLAESEGMSAANVRELAKQGGNVLANRIFIPSITKSEQKKTQAWGDILKTLMAPTTDKSQFMTFFNPDTQKFETETREKIYKKYQKQLTDAQRTDLTPEEAAKGKSLSSYVAAPILNYWSNRWIM